jgi:hypothetical protein
MGFVGFFTLTYNMLTPSLLMVTVKRQNNYSTTQLHFSSSFLFPFVPLQRWGCLVAPLSASFM